MNMFKLVLAALLATTLCACVDTKPEAKPNTPPIVGGDRDPHGCIPSAGYLWCQATNQCERPWELAQKNHLDASPEAFDKFCNGKK